MRQNLPARRNLVNAIQEMLLATISTNCLSIIASLWKLKASWAGSKANAQVSHPADGERFHVILPCDAAEIRPKAFADNGREPRTTFLGGEYAVHQAGIE